MNRISFEVKEGEIFGFLGPNGAGKTTTVRILTTLIKPDGGKAFVAGYDVLKNPIEVKKRIGVVPEVSNAYVDLTVWENLVLIGKLYGLPVKKIKENATELLKEFGLYDVRDKLVKFLSKGMKQRLLLCMALVNDPEVLFLDEPTSGLDVESARLLREKIVQYNGEGKTVFLSTPQHGRSEPALPQNSNNKPWQDRGYRHSRKPKGSEHGPPVHRSDFQQDRRSRDIFRKPKRGQGSACRQ